MMKQKANKKTEILQDIKFILSEFEKISQWSFSESSEEDRWKFLSKIEHVNFSDGKFITLTKDAISRFRKLTRDVINSKRCGSWLDYEEVYKSMIFTFDDRFISNKNNLSEGKVESFIAKSLKWAENSSCKDHIHYIPCRLMYPAKEQQPFNIGPVKFRCTQLFEEDLKEKFEAVSSSERYFLVEAWDYYQQFTWVAEIYIQGCSPKASKNKAILSVTAAVDTLQLIFGAYHTEKMGIGGPALSEDRRAHFHLDHLGNLKIDLSSNSTSSVSFLDDWLKIFEKEEAKHILQGIDKVIRSLNFRREYPVALRFIDALSWFGQAVREQFSAGKIIKGITALEHLLLLNEYEDKAETLAKRSASLLHLYTENHRDGQSAFKVKTAYGLRSELAHGSLSPFAVEVEEQASFILELVREIILCGLCFFEEEGVFESADITNKKLREFFDALLFKSEQYLAGQKILMAEPTQ